ncbi:MULTISPECIES: LysR family transcriptional regulator [unclassified Nocardioides]|uniref:LysR family transcriptional regulator n=1 Tax=unclassified Nocardioides TaxID=2615069 RepID=UPI0006F37B4A|nr:MULTISPECIES: LysR family transcriptional regulator [unclassified Nocardioides]KQY57330.1 LysR family transcriptional regulator [Nocardioides sp. Root140]KQZ68845.1 LysR family transcriptional regulator [Nocardioides sp. Root151]KRF20477.1 LysR family transcriptional regulator [Nocardioides sp. Soil796]
MDPRQLEYFLAVVEHGGVNRAATALHVAQPSLSQSLRRLEKDIQAQLFHRVGRGLVLSSAGEALIGPARQVLRDIELAREAVSAVEHLQGGRIDIAALSDTSTDPLSVWVAQFRVKNPLVQLRVEERDRIGEIVDLVKGGACELGITVLPVHVNDLSHDFLVDQHFVVVFPPGTPTDLPDTVEVSSLDGVPFVMGERNTTSRDHVESMLRAGGVEPLVAVEVPQRGAVVPMVLSGAGAAILPQRVALEARQRGAVVRDLSPHVSWSIGAIHRSDRLTPAAAAFLDYTHQQLASWERAVVRRMAAGASRVDASAEVVAAIERRQRVLFDEIGPIYPAGPAER